jgi:hypothetical protein
MRVEECEEGIEDARRFVDPSLNNQVNLEALQGCISARPRLRSRNKSSAQLYTNTTTPQHSFLVSILPELAYLRQRHLNIPIFTPNKGWTFFTNTKKGAPPKHNSTIAARILPYRNVSLFLCTTLSHLATPNHFHICASNPYIILQFLEMAAKGEASAFNAIIQAGR